MVKLSLGHPLILFLVSNLISTATAAFTQKDSWLRYLGFILCVAISWQTLSNFHFYVHNIGWVSRFLAGAVFSSPVVLFDRLLIRKWAFGHDYLGPAEASEVDRKKQSRWEFGSEVSGSIRCIGSSKEVANVPHFSAEDPQYVPSQSIFLLQHFCLVVGLHYLNTFLVDTQLRSDQAILVDAYVPFFSRITNVSLDEIIIRFKVSIAYWIAQYCTIQLLYSVLALISVSLKPSDLKLWRPQFGSITNCYTMRGFWGKFWHQNLQLNVKGPAGFIAHTILRIPPSTLLARYLKILLAFAASGITHIFADSGGAIPVSQSGALRFFCTQALGIMLEDGVQELYRRVFGDQQSAVCRAVGYVWVLAFLSWSSPVWVYPVVRTMKREDMMLTWGALHPLVEKLW